MNEDRFSIAFEFDGTEETRAKVITTITMLEPFRWSSEDGADGSIEVLRLYNDSDSEPSFTIKKGETFLVLVDLENESAKAYAVEDNGFDAFVMGLAESILSGKEAVENVTADNEDDDEGDEISDAIAELIKRCDDVVSMLERVEKSNGFDGFLGIERER